MPPPHVEAVQPAVPDRAADDAQRWFAQRMDFQLELARRMMNVDELDDGTMAQWAAQYAAQFAAVVDAKDAEGEEIRKCIRTDPDGAYTTVLQRLLH